MSDNPSNHKAIISKIYYLKERGKSQQREAAVHSTPMPVHLSSLIQSERRLALNKEMRQFALKFDSSHHFDSRLVHERAHSNFQLRDRRIRQKKQVCSSQDMRSKKLLCANSIYLSELADQTWSDGNIKQKQVQNKELQLSLSRKRNYLMRKYQFKMFLREQEEKKIVRPLKQIKEVVYEKEVANGWEIDQKQRRKKRNDAGFNRRMFGEDERRKKVRQYPMVVGNKVLL